MYDDGQPRAGADAISILRQLGVPVDGDMLGLIRACERVVAMVQAGQLALIAAFARSRPVEADEQTCAGASEFAVDELAAELRLSRLAAGGRLELAVRLAEELPGTAAALAVGDIDLLKARVIADATGSLDPPAARRVEARVLVRAVTQTAGQLRAHLTRAVLAVDPAGGQLRHERAAEARRVAVTAQPDGMAELWALLPAPAASAIYAAIDLHARHPCQPADAPIDARRADALVELVTRPTVPTSATATDSPPAAAAPTSATATDSPPAAAAPTSATATDSLPAGAMMIRTLASPTTTGGTPASRATAPGPTGELPTGERPAGEGAAARQPLAPLPALAPLVQVTVAATTLLRLDDQPAELAGHGPIPAELARQLAADPSGTWRRILTDPASGTVLDVSHRSYRPPRPLARYVIARDATCRFPGCRQPARRCDLDHVRPWPDGPTSAANLISLCRHHHRLKHSGRWTVSASPDATVTWTAPTGRSYCTRPRPIVDPAPGDRRPADVLPHDGQPSPTPPDPDGAGA
jgi:Domain of unknown function (DUF222)